MADYTMIGTKFGIIYTCNCGWFDRAHAHTGASRPGVGAASLLNAINSETTWSDTLHRQPAFVVSYSQEALKRIGPVKLYPGVHKH